MGGTPGPSERPLRPGQEPGGAVTPPPGSASPSGPVPTLRQRLAALAEKHQPTHGPAAKTEDDLQADQALATAPTTMAEGVAVLEAGLGDHIMWGREFGTHTLDDGSTVWVDKRTGQTYDALPPMHDKDGHDN